METDGEKKEPGDVAQPTDSKNISTEHGDERSIVRAKDVFKLVCDFANVWGTGRHWWYKCHYFVSPRQILAAEEIKPSNSALGSL